MRASLHPLPQFIQSITRPPSSFSLIMSKRAHDSSSSSSAYDPRSVQRQRQVPAAAADDGDMASIMVDDDVLPAQLAQMSTILDKASVDIWRYKVAPFLQMKDSLYRTSQETKQVMMGAQMGAHRQTITEGHKQSLLCMRAFRERCQGQMVRHHVLDNLIAADATHPVAMPPPSMPTMQNVATYFSKPVAQLRDLGWEAYLAEAHPAVYEQRQAKLEQYRIDLERVDTVRGRVYWPWHLPTPATTSDMSPFSDFLVYTFHPVRFYEDDEGDPMHGLFEERTVERALSIIMCIFKNFGMEPALDVAAWGMWFTRTSLGQEEHSKNAANTCYALVDTIRRMSAKAGHAIDLSVHDVTEQLLMNDHAFQLPFVGRMIGGSHISDLQWYGNAIWPLMRKLYHLNQ